MHIKIIAIVPARSGSKGFPNKNIAVLKEKTLIELAVKLAVDSMEVDDVYISTDSPDYERIAINAGAKSLGLRSEELSSEFAKTIDVIIDFLSKGTKDFDYVLLLQPTSPVRSLEDIKNIVRIIEENDCNSVVSVTKLNEPHPFKLKKITKSGYLSSFIEGKSSEIPRQLLPECYSLNGAFYLINKDVLLEKESFFTGKTMPYVMKHKINIDSEEDFLFLKSMVENGKVTIYGI